MPVTAMIADQQASAVGHLLMNPGDLKVTMGTGIFIEINSGSRLVFDTLDHIYTLIGWVIPSKPAVYLTETFVEELPNIRRYCVAREIDLKECNTTPDDWISLPRLSRSNGSFVYMDAGGLIISEEVMSKSVQVFLVLELLAFQVVRRIFSLTKRVAANFPLRVDGGMSLQLILLELIATMLEQPIARSKTMEMTSFGTALLAGLGRGLWKYDDMAMMALNVEKDIIQPNAEWRCILKSRGRVP